MEMISTLSPIFTGEKEHDWIEHSLNTVSRTKMGDTLEAVLLELEGHK